MLINTLQCTRPAHNKEFPSLRLQSGETEKSPCISTNCPVSTHYVIRNKGDALSRTAFFKRSPETLNSPRLTLEVPESSASPKQAFLTEVSAANEKDRQKRSRSTASSHSSVTESQAEKKFVSRTRRATSPADAGSRGCEARSADKGAALGPSRSLGRRACPQATLPASPASSGRKHHQLSLVWNNRGHLLVQNEVQVKSPVAGGTPFLPASPVPGADEHKSGQREPLEASAEGFRLHGGHDLQPRERVGSSLSHAPRTRQDPQGRAIRGALLSGPLFPHALPKLPGSNCLEEFKVFLLVSASILFPGFRFQESQYCTPLF